MAEQGKSLADLSGGAQAATGKVFINATSGFENVRLSVWQHTIGGYQVLHKWLDDRRKAGRSLSQDDITHWLRVYESPQATQALMQQVDMAIEAHGGWPGAFSQNYPPPDAATLATEQMAQKDQLKAQKKASASKNKSAASGNGFFDFGDDLDELAEASGAPPRPKAKATPAKAAGGKAATSSARTVAGKQAASVKAGTNGFTDWQAMCAIRAVLAREGRLDRKDLIRHTARQLDFARTSRRIATELESALRRAARRGIASNKRGLLSLVAITIEGYDRDFLKQHLLGCVRGHEAANPRHRYNAGLQACDYLLWALQRFYERNEERFLHAMWPKFARVLDLDAPPPKTRGKPASGGVEFNEKHPLTLESRAGVWNKDREI